MHPERLQVWLELAATLAPRPEALTIPSDWGPKLIRNGSPPCDYGVEQSILPACSIHRANNSSFMGIKMEGVAPSSSPTSSLYLTCRLASIVQKFKTRLQEKVSQRKKANSPFGASYHRGTRLRALSDLEKVQLPRRSQSICENPNANIHSREHAKWLSDHLDDLNEHTQSKALPLTEVAADDKLLFCQSHETLVEALTERISLQHVAYLFDLSTFLIHRLETVSNDTSNAAQGWYVYNDDCERLKNEKYIANLLHLLRRLQFFLFQILVHRSIKKLDELHDYFQQRDLSEGHALDEDWFSEWPSGRRPLSTTWPWNIKPSLVVLWGVCWMFYTPPPGNEDNASKVPADLISDSNGFFGYWGQNVLPSQELEEARNVESLLGPRYHSDEDNSSLLAQHELVADDSVFRRPSSAPQAAAPHVKLDHASLAQNHPSTPSFPSGISATYAAYQSGVTGFAPGPQTQQNAYINRRPAFPASPVSRDPEWPVSAGGNISPYAYAGYERPPNVFYQGYNQPGFQAETFLPHQNASAIPGIAVSPVTGPPHFPDVDSPTPHYLRQRRLQLNTSTAWNPMGIPQEMNQQQERQRSASLTTNPSPLQTNLASPVEYSTPTSEGSSRQRVSVRRLQEPPKNDQDEIYCDHPECAKDPPTFRRPCEWNKHMDKHDRPYKCTEAGCDKVQGFTYSGGLLRHQREVHKKNVSTKAPLFCPYPNCNRHTGTGFTRKENLNEHIRRRHVGESGSEGPASPLVRATPRPSISSTEANGESSRKRRRTTIDTESAIEEAENEEFDDSGIADTEDLKETVKRLRYENEEKDRRIQAAEARIRYLEYVLKHPNQLMAAPAPPTAPR